MNATSHVPPLPHGWRPHGLVRSAEKESATAVRMLDDIACAIAASAPTVCRTLVVHGDVAQELDRIAAADDAVLVALGHPGHAFARPATRRLIRREQRAVIACPDPEAVFAGTEPLSSGRRARVDLRPTETTPRPTGRSRRT